LTESGVPTQRYNEYRNRAASKAVMAEALENSFREIFLITEKPTEKDSDAIQGKFKSYHNVSDNLANLMTKTFFGLAKLADFDASREVISASSDRNETDATEQDQQPGSETERNTAAGFPNSGKIDFRYNIQIHLPPTKDQEVYNAIFKSLKEHLMD
jgi:hypothetical protein